MKRSVRIAFTEREGGESTGSFSSLNVGKNTRDCEKSVEKNRSLIREAFIDQKVSCLAPKQVHGDSVCRIYEGDAQPLDTLAAMNVEGVDALVVEAKLVPALLCFADCVPVAVVSPSGRFALIHAGWKGVKNGIALKAFEMLMLCDKEAGIAFSSDCYNVYLGPFIHGECFQVDAGLHESFVRAFGGECAFDESHIDLGRALRQSFYKKGVPEERIAMVGQCTVCNNDKFFSYRAQDGTCGRHGAFGVRV